MRVAVVGHVEWIEFARVERMPAAGEIVHASDAWEEPGGGGGSPRSNWPGSQGAVCS
jgi:ribokinase